jgi:NADH:ubiquinone oxidoreductase subunit H
MNIGWKCFLPLTLGFIVFTASVLICFNILPE